MWTQVGRCLGLGDEWMLLKRTEGLAPFPFDLLSGPVLHCLVAKFRSGTRGVN